MKALSLTQPWATLVAVRAKRIETRDWRVSYRGPLGIHASKAFPRDCIELCFEEPFASALRAAGIAKPADLPRGAIIAVVDLTGCFPTPPEGVAWREYFDGFRVPPEEPERSFGNYSPNRVAWRLENVHALAEPIPCRGALGLWTPPPDVLAQLNAAVLA